MMKSFRGYLGSYFILFLILFSACQPKKEVQIAFETADDDPWVFWYWMFASASEAGITADLEAMKEAGLAGAYLMPILGEQEPLLFQPSANQLSPQWWKLMKHAFAEAKRLDLQLGLHASDGFAVAGGPWITPEESMQKLVFAEQKITGGQLLKISLEQPEIVEDYYEDVAIYAYRAKENDLVSSYERSPKVSVIANVESQDWSFLAQDQKKKKLKTGDPTWVQYEFEKPFVCRAIRPNGPSTNLQWQKMTLLASEDGVSFDTVMQMVPPRQGWQNGDATNTYSIPETTAKYFRVAYESKGTEPGAEDLDAGKWKAKLVLYNVEFLGSPKLHQYEGKAAEAWRVADRTNEHQVSESLCIQPEEMIDLSSYFENGVLNWEAPEGEWIVMRIGHTSTGHTNYTGGGALGLECNKFSKEATEKQFKHWYGAIVDSVGKEYVGDVLTKFHVDSWECGSQNWSGDLLVEFEKRRGYDPKPYLPCLNGVPVATAEESEKFLYDYRTTIGEMYVERFYQPLHVLAQEYGVEFSAENVSPTMMSDGLRHFADVDLPMGEFWFRSPTHDKPNDMMDAISGAHIYDKNIVQAEGFTQLRMDWDEHPAVLKTLGDKHLALGVNRLWYHVFTHNPWMNKKPGMTLNGVGLYFQRDQIWWKLGRAWVDYMEQCQALLQNGYPVVDIAVFTGEEMPRRSMTPDRLVEVLPGLVGAERVASEKLRLANEGEPTVQEPIGVTHAANMAVHEDWSDPLNGYKYDAFNPHALLNLANVVDHKVRFAGENGYSLLVIPGSTRMNPAGTRMSDAVLKKLRDLVMEGATVLFADTITGVYGMEEVAADRNLWINDLLGGDFRNEKGINVKSLGQGKVIKGAFAASDLSVVERNKDFAASENNKPADLVTWTHRKVGEGDLYFVSNQKDEERILDITLGVDGFEPELFNPVTKTFLPVNQFTAEDGRTSMQVRFSANAALFVLFRKQGRSQQSAGKNWIDKKPALHLEGNWDVSFESKVDGRQFAITTNELFDWATSDDERIKYFAGKATYKQSFEFNQKNKQVWLSLAGLEGMAEVTVNGKECGVIWTAPYELEVNDALIDGKNEIEITVYNTWRNALIGDHLSGKDQLWTKAPYLLEGRPLASAGLTGGVSLMVASE